jgi:hypothetical protein
MGWRGRWTMRSKPRVWLGLYARARSVRLSLGDGAFELGVFVTGQRAAAVDGKVGPITTGIVRL